MSDKYAQVTEGIFVREEPQPDYVNEFKRAMRDCRRTVQERMTPKGDDK